MEFPGIEELVVWPSWFLHDTNFAFNKIAALSVQRQVSFQHFDRIDSAIAHALERAGHLLMRRT